MSHPTLKIGEAVYRPYFPKNYGKVLDKRPAHDFPEYYEDYLVRWKDGSEGWVWQLHLNSLEKLVEDHKRKIKTHEKTIKEAKRL